MKITNIDYKENKQYLNLTDNEDKIVKFLECRSITVDNMDELKKVATLLAYMDYFHNKSELVFKHLNDRDKQVVVKLSDEIVKVLDRDLLINNILK